jgi:hypothetical protein
MAIDPMQAWQAFSDAARSYLQAAGNPARAPDAAQRLGDFLREQFAAASHPWQSPSMPAGFSSSTPPPAFGATREHQERAQRILEAVQRIDAAQRRLQRLWSDVLRDASAKFLGQLSRQQPASPNADYVRNLYDSWIESAEDAYSRVAHSEAYCEAQAELANASSQLRAELWLKALDLPTRSEVNSLTRRLRELEARLRARAVQPAPKAAQSPPKKASKRARQPVKRTAADLRKRRVKR